MKNLIILKLERNSVYTIGASFLASLKNLIILSLGRIVFTEDCNQIGDGGAKSISKVHKLEELSLCRSELIFRLEPYRNGRLIGSVPTRAPEKDQLR